MKRILLTGATGFIGKVLLRELLENKEDVTCLVRNKNKITTTKTVEADLTNDKINISLKDFDVIIHLAAETKVIEAQQNPQKVFDTNIKGTFNLLKDLDNFSGKLIYVSTIAVYGNKEKIPTDENAPAVPIELYGGSKLAAESIIMSSCKSKNIKYCIARVSNIYSEDKNCLIGQFAKKIKEGSKIELKNFAITRDFIFLKDVISAVLFLIKNGEGVYNIGSGKETTLLELSKKICKTLGKNVEIIENKNHGRPTNIEIWKSSINIKKIKNLGWTPKYTLTEGLKEALLD